MKTKSTRKHSRTSAKRPTALGQPVCAVLKDGRYFIGRIEGVRDGELILSGVKGTGRWHPGSKQANRAQVSGFLDSLLGGLGGMGGSGGSGGMGGGLAFGGSSGAGTGGQTDGESGGNSALGGLGGMLSTIRIGMNMLQAIMPLLSLFKV